MSEVVFEAVSVCKVIEGMHSSPDDYLLKRFYDLDVENGELHRVFFQDYMPRYFGNRDWIYKNDGPEALGTIGVWSWNSRPNNSDPDKDYVRSSYQPQIHLVFAKVLADVESIKELLEKVKCGIDFGFINACKENWMILFKDPVGDYSGVYCERGMLDSHSGANGKSGYLKSSVTRLQKVGVGATDIYSLGEQKIYRFLDIDPLGEVLVRSANEIVKSCILNRMTWKSFNSFTGGTHSEHNLFKNFLNSITVDIYREVAEKCGCDIDIAKGYVNDFVGIANTYIEGKDIETDLLLSLIEGRADIRERFEKEIESRWFENNKKRMEEKEAEIAAAIERKDHIGIVIQDLLDQQKKEEKQYQDSIIAHRKILEEFEAELNKKIETIKDNLGVALADSVYFERLAGGKSHVGIQSKETIFIQGAGVTIDEELENGDDVFDLLKHNIIEAGVSRVWADIVGAFLTVVAYNNAPLILAGPNGEEIADAISITLYGRNAGRYTSWNNSEILADLDQVEETVIVFENFCKTDFVDILPGIIRKKKRLFIFTTPYYEDLFVEPTGLFNYAFPLITEWFVDSYAQEAWVGGIASEQWRDSVEREKVRKNIINTMRSIKMRPYLQNKYLDVLGEANYYLDNKERKVILSYLTSLAPYALTTSNMEGLYDCLQNDEAIDSSIKDAIRELCGE